jgi:hypothetical protein
LRQSPPPSSAKEDIDKIISTMTKENATKMILQFLPDPIEDKFAQLLGIKLDIYMKKHYFVYFKKLLYLATIGVM